MTALVQLTPAAATRPAHVRPTLEQVLSGSRYGGYTYAYPHKTAYRPFEPAIDLPQLWAAEPAGPTFFYVHVPFCEMRCGFCNLFTRARPQGDLQEQYVQAVLRQAEQVRAATGPRTVDVLAFGGGTPTQLSVPALEKLLRLPEKLYRVSTSSRPTSVETSPETASAEHLAQLADFGITRVSIGIQSFEANELAALGRPLKVHEGEQALERIKAVDIPVLNLDLIYGIEGQTMQTWLRSLQRALQFEPEEVFLYPLYVRPLTGLGRRDRAWTDLRPDMYEQARLRLLDAGYEQRSMRSFAKPVPAAETSYRCQSDAMVGLGCGARSYTGQVHYSSEWAVGARGVKEILAAWVEREDFSKVEYGYRLDDHERRIRHVLQSLLHIQGVDRAWYTERFGADVLEHFPDLSGLVDRGLASATPERLGLTAEGLAWSDALGPWLYSDAVLDQMEAFDLR